MNQEEKDKLYHLSLDIKTITDKMQKLPLSANNKVCVNEIEKWNQLIYMTSIEVTT